MERQEAKIKISMLIGQDLRALAQIHNINVWTGFTKNKGWAGHVIERFLDLPLNSAQAPNFGSWELKVIPLKYNKKGEISIKETMAITMIDPVEVAKNDFENSHLFRKLNKILLVARIWVNIQETHTPLYSVTEFDLDDPMIYNMVKADYEAVQEVIRTVGFQGLTGKMGKIVQPRTKGRGHGSTSRAFYARTQFLAYVLGLRDTPTK